MGRSGPASCCGGGARPPRGFWHPARARKDRQEWSQSAIPRRPWPSPRPKLEPGPGNLAAHVMRGWVERDLHKAAAWLGAADAATHDRLLPAFVETWGKKDAAAALEWCQTNATGSLQSDVICALVKGTTERSLDEAAAMVAGLDPSPARLRAATTFAQAALNKGWFPGIIRPNPETNSQARSDRLARSTRSCRAQGSHFVDPMVLGRCRSARVRRILAQPGRPRDWQRCHGHGHSISRAQSSDRSPRVGRRSPSHITRRASPKPSEHGSDTSRTPPCSGLQKLPT